MTPAKGQLPTSGNREESGPESDTLEGPEPMCDTGEGLLKYAGKILHSYCVGKRPGDHI